MAPVRRGWRERLKTVHESRSELCRRLVWRRRRASAPPRRRRCFARFGGLLIGILVEHRSEALARVPFDMIGEHARRNVSAHAVPAKAIGRTRRIDGLDAADGVFNLGEALLGSVPTCVCRCAGAAERRGARARRPLPPAARGGRLWPGSWRHGDGRRFSIWRWDKGGLRHEKERPRDHRGVDCWRTQPCKTGQSPIRPVKASHEQLREALRGRATDQHRLRLRLHLNQMDSLPAAIASIDAQVKANLGRFREAVDD